MPARSIAGRCARTVSPAAAPTCRKLGGWSARSAGRRWLRPRTAALHIGLRAAPARSAIRAEVRPVGIVLSGVSSAAATPGCRESLRPIEYVRIRRVERDDGVVRIVGAVQEHADQRFVAACDLRGSGADRSEVQRKGAALPAIARADAWRRNSRREVFASSCSPTSAPDSRAKPSSTRRPCRRDCSDRCRGSRSH